MKLSFRRGDAAQPAVKPLQGEMRQAKPRKYPIFINLVRGAVIAGLAWGAWSLVRGTRIHSYGIVGADSTVYTAPVASHLDALYVGVGQRVGAGDALYVLVSDDARAELVAARAARLQQQTALDALIASLQQGNDATLDDVRSLQAASAAWRAVEAAHAGAIRDAQVAGAARARAQASATPEWERAVLIAAAAKRKAEDLGVLVRLEAASVADHARAELEAHLARLSADATRAHVDALQREAAAAQAADIRELLRLEADLRLARSGHDTLAEVVDRQAQNRSRQRTDDLAIQRSRLAGSDERIAYLARLAGPTEVRARADGVVMALAGSEGTGLAAGAEAMTLLGTGGMWIDGYVPIGRLDDLSAYTRAEIIDPATGAVIPATIASDRPVVVVIPAAVRRQLHDEPSAVRIRILPQTQVSLVPGSVVRLKLSAR